MSVGVLNMKRIDGFLNLNEILEVDDVMNIFKLIKQLKKIPGLKIVKKFKSKNNTQLVFSFRYNNTTYYFKYDALIENGIPMIYPYNELLAYYVAKDMNLPCVCYDLATIGGLKGVISKDFKESKAQYISGKEILLFNYGKNYFVNNNLLDSWVALEEYYRFNPNKQSIVKTIVYELIKLFIFDIFLGQTDRHYFNWGIVEYDNGEVHLQPICDNYRILIGSANNIDVEYQIDSDTFSVKDNIYKFLRESDKEFSDLFASFLWVISPENIDRIINLIELETNNPMPENVKNFYKIRLKEYYNYFNELLQTKDFKLVRETHK